MRLSAWGYLLPGICTSLGNHKGTGFHSLKWTVPTTQTRHEICNCKHTKSPPYCDGTHTNLPEVVLERQKKCRQKEERHKGDCKLCTNCGWVPDFWRKLEIDYQQTFHEFCDLNALWCTFYSYNWIILHNYVALQCGPSSGVDVNSEVLERYRKILKCPVLMISQKFLRFFLSKILNDLFWPITNECRNAQYKAFPLVWQ